jgi:MFS family permease
MLPSLPILRKRRLRALGRSMGGGRGAWAMARGSEFYLIMASAFFYFGAEFGTNAWLPAFLISAKGISAMEAGLALGAFWGTIGIGRFALGGFVDRIGYRRAISILSVLSAASMALGFTAHGPALYAARLGNIGPVDGGHLPHDTGLGDRLLSRAFGQHLRERSSPSASPELPSRNGSSVSLASALP